ncbi:unnamed protein product [Moneuplotes crassus]|uniref:Glutathione S-transferase n=1 Tax=Euplotes crassus TaxID=5936 RepID=A0AAD1XVE5_EUPCR|nr:unnamed protein product [Moneuplotes crassus]
MVLIKYWGFSASQPCRTVLYVLRSLGIEYEHHEIRPRLDTRAEWFMSINRFSGAPAIEYNGTKMIESVAISRFLCSKYDQEYMLFPKDEVARQKVDALLDINACYLRPVFMNSYWDLKLSQICFNAPERDEEFTSTTFDSIKINLGHLDQIVKSNKKNHSLENCTSLSGSNKTLADVQIYNEVYNVAYQLEINLKEDFPYLQEWYDSFQNDQLMKELDQEMIISFDNIIKMYKEILDKQES